MEKRGAEKKKPEYPADAWNLSGGTMKYHESSVILQGYAEHEPFSDKGKINWNAATHLFTLNLKAPLTGNNVIVHLKAK